MTITNANGKVCYLEIPAADVTRSAEFYRAVFGWQIRTRSNGSTAFDDGVEVSGTFVRGRPPARETGLLIYVMVADADATLKKITAHGGEIVEPVHPGAPEVVARFHDPAGNLMGIYQEKALAGGRSGDRS
jgi:predicted enzyme related to lactoylglutathione lyase